MSSYKNFVEGLAKNKEDQLFLNSGPIHAAIVFSSFFKYSEKTVRIFLLSFQDAVYTDPDYLYELEKFLMKGGNIKVLIKDYNLKTESKFYKILSKYFSKGQVKIKKSTLIINTDNKDIYFTIGDNRMIRVETNPNTFKSQVNFNNEIESANFINLFDTAFSISPEIKYLNQ